MLVSRCWVYVHTVESTLPVAQANRTYRLSESMPSRWKGSSTQYVRAREQMLFQAKSLALKRRWANHTLQAQGTVQVAGKVGMNSCECA